MNYRFSKIRLGEFLAKQAMFDGFNHSTRFSRKALSEDEMPGKFLEKLKERNPEIKNRVSTLTAKHFQYNRYK